ncbi:MAG: CvpA family protein [Victivallales bacterium]|nr:CvpA family protein [Victivallales bacterium]
MRKASSVILLLCLAIAAAEFKGYGQGIWDKLKLPKLPEPPPLHEQGGVAQPTPPQNENVSEQTPSTTEQTDASAEPSSTSSENTLATSLEALNFHEGEFDWRKDWWKALLFALGGVIIVAFLMRIAKQLFRIIVLTACLAAGGFGARYFAPPLTPWVESKLPPALTQSIPPLYWSFVIVFLVCYILATIILFILKRPLDIMDKRQKCQTDNEK